MSVIQPLVCQNQDNWTDVDYALDGRRMEMEDIVTAFRQLWGDSRGKTIEHILQIDHFLREFKVYMWHSSAVDVSTPASRKRRLRQMFTLGERHQITLHARKGLLPRPKRDTVLNGTDIHVLRSRFHALMRECTELVWDD